MKLAIINDTHHGVRNGSDIFLDYSARFYENTFFPYLLEHGIKKIIHLGDYFEHRKYVNFKVLKHNHKTFISKLEEHDIHMDIILGNHCVYYKNTNELNSLNEILDQYANINVVTEPTVASYDSLDMLLLPWMCAANEERSLKAIRDTTAPILAGHLELDGFEMMRGVKATHGMETKPFDKFDLVMSGHYHTKSSRNNIHYLGTQLQLTFADANEQKYFHVLDTETRELTPVENYDTMFHKLVYDENNVPDITETLKNTYVKVIILNKKNLYEFDKWFDKLQRIGPFEIKVSESFEEYLGDNVEDEGINTADTPTLLNSYIEATETDLNKEVLKKLMHELYVEAQNMTDI